MLIERDGRWFVQGAMTMTQAASLLAQGDELCAKADCTIDLCDVSSADSSAVAVVLGWVRRAREAGLRLQVLNPPPSFVSLAALYGVDELLMPFMGSSADKGGEACV